MQSSVVALGFRSRHNCLAVCNRIVVFVVAQLRKALPKKPEGEIKPYSLMEREGEYNIKHPSVGRCDAFITFFHGDEEVYALSCSGSGWFK